MIYILMLFSADWIFSLFIPYILYLLYMLKTLMKTLLSMDAMPLTVMFPEHPAPKFWMRFQMDVGDFEHDLDLDEVVLDGRVSWSFCRVDRDEIVRHWIALMVVRFPWF